MMNYDAHSPHHSKPRPWWCTLLGVLAYIGGTIELLPVLFLLFLMVGFGGAESLTTILPIVLLWFASAVIAFIQGYGFLKMKKWLPYFLITMTVIGTLAALTMFPDISFENAFDFLTIIGVLIGITITWYVYSKRTLFKN